MGNRFELLFRVAGTGGNDSAAECARTGINQPCTRCQVVGERIVDDISGTEAGRIKCTR